MVRRRELVDRPYYANRARRNRSFSRIVHRARTFVGFLAEFVFMHCRHVLTDVVVGFCSFCIDIIENKHGVTSAHVDLEFLQNKQKGTYWDFNCFALFAFLIDVLITNWRCLAFLNNPAMSLRRMLNERKTLLVQSDLEQFRNFLQILRRLKTIFKTCSFKNQEN